MTRFLHVLNASSRKDTGITDDLARSLGWMNGPDMPQIRCITLENGPNGIANSVDSARAASAVLDHIAARATDPAVSAFVVACFSDPGVNAARELTDKPVIGIGEAALASAVSIGERIGTIGVSAGQSGKTRAFLRERGFIDRFGGHRALGLDYADLQYADRVAAALQAAALSLKAEDDVDVIVLAGAGMARYVHGLRQATGLAVIDPTLAAVTAAVTATAWHDNDPWA